jgi:hypothetical protein
MLYVPVVKRATSDCQQDKQKDGAIAMHLQA